jgi:hypothetical protein
MHFAQALIFPPSTFLVCKLGRILRFVLIFEWLREKEVCGPRPQISQILDIDFFKL